MWDNVTENKTGLSGSGFKITECNKIEWISITKFHKELNSNNLMIPTLATNLMLTCQRNGNKIREDILNARRKQYSSSVFFLNEDRWIQISAWKTKVTFNQMVKKWFIHDIQR